METETDAPSTVSVTHRQDIEGGQRFRFGSNWHRFLLLLDDDRVRRAQASLREMLELPSLQGRRFLDIGCGSGLFSLAARRLGARVHSFDFDPESVACTREMRARFLPDDRDWVVEEGSVLDREYLRSLGEFDIVYAWGVLHHTGAMWDALANVAPLVSPGGRLFLAIYNDGGSRSRLWRRAKRLYCSGRLGRMLISGVFIPKLFLTGLAADLVRMRNPIRRYSNHKAERGMSLYHDWVDWLGGYPYEVAKPAQIVEYYHGRGFRVIRWKRPDWRLGNNEFVLQRVPGGRGQLAEAG